MSAESQSGYADLRETKRRLNIADSVTASDNKIKRFMNEADNYTNTQINLHALTPIDNPDPELISDASSLAAAMFNYWQTPVKDRSLGGVNQWKATIQGYIMATYGRKNPTRLGGGEMFTTSKTITGTR